MTRVLCTCPPCCRLPVWSRAGQARRDIDGGGVKLDGEAIAPKTYNVDPAALKPGTVLQVGKRKIARLA